MEGPLFKEYGPPFKTNVHCYNYTIQGCRNWPDRLSSSKDKISPRIKNSCDQLRKQEI